MAILENVKLMKGIKDTLQDDVLNVLINNAESRLTVWLKQHAGLETIPIELLFIVEELTVARFNRLGSESMTSESVEGHSVTFTDDDFQPYLSILETYIPKKEKSTAGKVVFF